MLLAAAALEAKTPVGVGAPRQHSPSAPMPGASEAPRECSVGLCSSLHGSSDPTGGPQCRGFDKTQLTQDPRVSAAAGF